MNRQKLPNEVSTEVLLKSRRRCCICFGLQRDSKQKKGQLAHLDKDRENNESQNIAFLCLEHHDEYDSKTSQSKGITLEEVKRYREDLYRFIDSEISIRGDKSEQSQIENDYWRFKAGPTMAEIGSALELYSGPHRTRAVLMLLAAGPKTLAEIQAAVPGTPDWIRTISDSVVNQKWAFGPLETHPQYRITPAGERILRVLEVIPEFIKNAAWRANWSPEG